MSPSLSNVAALAAADARRPRGIQFMRERDQFRQKSPDLGQHGFFAEENLVAHAPRDDGRMIAVDADHVAQAVLHALLKRRLVLRHWSDRRWHSNSRLEPSAHAPKTIFRPEQNAQLVARVRERRGVRIMRAANEMKARVLHQFHVAEKSAVRHRVAPARVILMHVRAFEIKMLAVQEKSLVRRPLEPAETKRRFKIVGEFAAVKTLLTAV
jgi:hypothetical protein